MLKYSVISGIACIILYIFHFQSPVHAQVVEVINGVRVVHNETPQWSSSVRVELKFVQKLGGRHEHGSMPLFSYPFDVGIDALGNILIVDAGNDRILKCDSSGNVLVSYGRKGSSHGEFLSPVSIDADKTGRLYIGDLDNNRVQVLSSEGSYLRSFDGGGDIAALRVLNSGKIVMGTSIEFSHFGNVKQQLENKLVRIFEPDGSIGRSFGKPLVYHAASILIADRSYQFAVDRDDYIYIAYKHRNLIEQYNPEGKLLLQIDRPLNFDVTRITLAEGVELLGTERPNYISADIAIDDKGRIWLLTYRRQPLQDDNDSGVTVSDLFEFEIFDNNGILLGKLPLLKYFDKFRIFGDRLFLIDLFKDMSVHEYKIVEK